MDEPNKEVTKTSVNDDSTSEEQIGDARTVQKIKKISSILMVIVSGLALFSDGYNAVSERLLNLSQ